MAYSLKNNGIILRPLEPEDLSFLYACENNTENWQVSNTLAPFSKYILKQYIENSHLDIYTTKQLRLIIELEETGLAIGAIDLFDFDPFHQRAGVGVLISDSSNRKQGYAFQALQLLIEYCFNHLQLHQVYCNIGSENKASIKLFTKAGFQKMAEKTDWIKTDSGWESELSFQLINSYLS